MAFKLPSPKKQKSKASENHSERDQRCTQNLTVVCFNLPINALKLPAKPQHCKRSDSLRKLRKIYTAKSNMAIVSVVIEGEMAR